MDVFSWSDRCLICLEPLDQGCDRVCGCHASCHERLYGVREAVRFGGGVLDRAGTSRGDEEFSHPQDILLAEQPRLPLYLRVEDGVGTFEVGTDEAWNYELKFPSEKHPYVVELEAVCMCLARLCGIPCVAGGMVELPDGRRGYIWRRVLVDGLGVPVDRYRFGVLLDLSWGTRYRKGYLGGALQILLHSTNPRESLLSFWRSVLFAYLTGCGDLNQDDFALVRDGWGNCVFAPMQRLVPTAVLFPEVGRELGLSLFRTRRRFDALNMARCMNICGFSNREFHALADGVLSLVPAMIDLISSLELGDWAGMRWLSIVDGRARRWPEEWPEALYFLENGEGVYHRPGRDGYPLLEDYRSSPYEQHLQDSHGVLFPLLERG